MEVGGYILWLLVGGMVCIISDPISFFFLCVVFLRIGSGVKQINKCSKKYILKSELKYRVHYFLSYPNLIQS